MENTVKDKHIHSDTITIKHDIDITNQTVVNISKDEEYQNGDTEGCETGSSLGRGNDDKDILDDKNGSPSMLNELADAIIADNFEALKDDEQNVDTPKMSSRKYWIPIGTHKSENL